MGEQVMDAPYSGGEPLVAERAATGQSEGRAAEIGEGKREFVPYPGVA
jgi:hypothetical protein